MASHPCESCPRLRELLACPSREWFASNGWSPSRIASAIGVNRSTVSRWLSSGSIPLSGQYDLSRLALDIVVHGGRHEQ